MRRERGSDERLSPEIDPGRDTGRRRFIHVGDAEAIEAPSGRSARRKSAPRSPLRSREARVATPAVPSAPASIAARAGLVGEERVREEKPRSEGGETRRSGPAVVFSAAKISAYRRDLESRKTRWRGSQPDSGRAFRRWRTASTGTRQRHAQPALRRREVREADRDDRPGRADQAADRVKDRPASHRPGLYPEGTSRHRVPRSS